MLVGTDLDLDLVTMARTRLARVLRVLRVLVPTITSGQFTSMPIRQPDTRLPPAEKLALLHSHDDAQHYCTTRDGKQLPSAVLTHCAPIRTHESPSWPGVFDY